MKIEKCPDCGSTDILQEEVDVGVGIIFGPARCQSCGWDQEDLCNMCSVDKSTCFLRGEEMAKVIACAGLRIREK